MSWQDQKVNASRPSRNGRGSTAPDGTAPDSDAPDSDALKFSVSDVNALNRSSAQTLTCRPNWLAKHHLGIRLSRWLKHATRLPGSRRVVKGPSAGGWQIADEYVPSLRVLEPRIVLNASAELSDLAGLSISGDVDNDFVQVESVNGGTEIQLRDSLGNIIPIIGHTGGVNGLETDPLAVSDIAGGALEVDLGSGNDELVMELVDGIQLSVLETEGTDVVRLDVQPSPASSQPITLDVSAELIDFSPSGDWVDLGDRQVMLKGQVTVGDVGTAIGTVIDVGAGSLQIEGSLQLFESTQIRGNGSVVDLGGATVLASDVGIDLAFDLGSGAGSSLTLGDIGSEFVEKLNDLDVTSVGEAVFESEFEIGGALSVDADGEVHFQKQITAASMDVDASEVSFQEGVVTQQSGVFIQAADSILLRGDFRTDAAGIAGDVSLQATTLEFDAASISTSGGDVAIDGSSLVSGDVRIETAEASSVGGNVDWAGEIVSAPGGLASLMVNAAATGSSGNVSLGDIGAAGSADADDLSDIRVDAGLLVVGNLGVTGGVIELNADATRIIGQRFRSTVSGAAGGDIRLTGEIDFEAASTQIDAGASLFISGDAEMVTPLGHLSLASGEAIDLRGSLAGGGRLEVAAGAGLELQADTSGWREIELQADSQISLSGNQLSADSGIVFSGDVQVANDLTVEAPSIRFESVLTIIGDQTLSLEGRAEVGASTVPDTVIDVGTGEWVVEGELVLAGSTSVRGTSGSVDLTGATTSALSGGTDLGFAFESSGGSTIRMGGVDDSGGALLSDLRVLSANSADFVGGIQLENAFEVRVAESIQVQTGVEAGEVVQDARSIFIMGPMESHSGGMSVVASDVLDVAGDLTTRAGAVGSVELSANSIGLSDVKVSTSGAAVNLLGPTLLSGRTVIDTAVGVGAGGDVTFTDSVQSATFGTTGSLSINSVGATGGGEVRFEAAVGGSSEGAVENLSGLSIVGSGVRVSDIGVTGGDVEIVGTTIRSTGSIIRSNTASGSDVGGSIEILGGVIFEGSSTSVVASTTLLLEGDSSTSFSGNDVSLRSGTSATLRGSLIGGDELDVSAGTTLELQADLWGWRTIGLAGGTDITIESGLLAADESIRFSGEVEFQSVVIVQSDQIVFDGGWSIDDGAGVQFFGELRVGGALPGETIIDIGSGLWTVDGKFTLAGSTRIVGTTGTADLTDATTSANSSGLDLQFELANLGGSQVFLGTVDGSGGDNLSNLRALSATQTVLSGDVSVSGEVVVDVSANAAFLADVVAGNVDVKATDVGVSGSLESQLGPISLVASGQAAIHGVLDSVSAGTAGSLLVSGAAILLSNAAMRTAGGTVAVSGPTILSGDVEIDSVGGAASGGQVTFNSAVGSSVGVPAGGLLINAEGGVVQFQGNIGGTAAGDGTDIRQLVVRSSELELRNLGVDGGAIDLQADRIQLAGAMVRSTGAGGSIRMIGDTTFASDTTVVESGASLLLEGDSRTSSAGAGLTLRSFDSSVLKGSLSGGDQLLVSAGESLQLDADLRDWNVIELAGDLGIKISASEVIATESVEFSDAVSIESDLTVTSTSIEFASSLSLQDSQTLQLNGGVQFGAAVVSETLLNLSSGTLAIDGSLTLAGSTRVVGADGFLDLSSAVTSARAGGFDFSVALTDPLDSRADFGLVDDSAGSLLSDLQVVAARDANFGNAVTVSDDFSVNVSGAVYMQGPVSAGQVAVRGEHVDVLGDVQTASGGVILSAAGALQVAGDISTVLAGGLGRIQISGDTVLINESTLEGSGTPIVIEGPVTLVGPLEIDTAVGVDIGGDVTFTDTIRSGSVGPVGRLSINSVGAVGGGEVRLEGSVGGWSEGAVEDLSRLLITGGGVWISDIGVTGGEVSVQGTTIHSTGSMIRSNAESGSGLGGSVEFLGDVIFAGSNTSVVASTSLLLEGDSSTPVSSNNVLLQSGTSAILRGSLAGGDALQVSAGTTLDLQAELSGWRTIDLSGVTGIQVDSALIQSVESVRVRHEVNFADDTLVHSSAAQFDSSITVEDDRSVEINASLVDSAGQDVLQKLGGGQLILSAQNVSTTDLSIAEGTLRLDGRTAEGSNIDVQSGGLLAGSGVAEGHVKVRGGVLSPNEFLPGGDTGQLTVGSLEMLGGSSFDVQVEGSEVGESLDSVQISDGPIRLGNAILNLQVAATLAGDTELVLVDNGTAQDVSGRFLAYFDENGNPLAMPRLLEDGALVLQQFGPGGDAVEAYLTYFGGDGNDVTIVTAGDTVQPVGNVILVQRSGVNLQVRSGDTLAEALASDPTVRPLAGLNGHDVILNPIASGAQLFIDVDGFSGLGGDPLQFNSDFLFDASAVGGDASFTLYDSDPTTPDRPERFVADYLNADAMILKVDHAEGVAPDYRVIVSGTTVVDLQLSSAELEILLTDFADDALFRGDADPNFSTMDLTSNGVNAEFRFAHPDDIMTVDGRGGSDFLLFESMGSNFDAVTTVEGGEDRDELIWDADVAVGESMQNRTFRLNSELVSVGGDIDLVGGGNLELLADEALKVTSLLDSNDGRIVIRSEAILSDLGLGTLRSEATGDAISLAGGNFLLGRTEAVFGGIELGDETTGSIGTVRQETGTWINVLNVTGDSRGSVLLDSLDNQISAVDLTAGSDVTVMDSDSGLSLFLAAGGSVLAQTAGELLVGTVASGGDVQLSAGTQVVGTPGQLATHVSGRRVELNSAVGFPGQNGPQPGSWNIGSQVNPIRVQVEEAFFASTSSSNGSIYIHSPGFPGSSLGDGRLPVGVVDAGEGAIELSSYSMDDIGSDSSADLIGDRVKLTAQTGIGGQQTLGITGASVVEADSANGSIGLDLFSDRDVTLQRVLTGGGDGESIRVEHFGTGVLSVGQVANANGDVSLVSQLTGITILPSSGEANVNVGGGGKLLIETLGPATSIEVAGTIQSETGAVSLQAQREIVFSSEARLDSSDGDVELVAGLQASLTDSRIDMADGSRVNVGAGTATLIAPGDIRLSSVASEAAGDAIRIRSENGSLIDAGDSDFDIDADAGTVRIAVASGIGADDPLEIRVGQLYASVSQAGGIRLSEATEIELADVVTHDGQISVVAAGELTAQRVVSNNASGQDGDIHRDIYLETVSSDADILVGSVVADGEADVTLVSGDDMTRLSRDSLIEADDLRLVSFNGSGDGPNAVWLQTAINDLELSVKGPERGDVQIDEADSLNLAASDRADDGEQLRTSNGEIRVSAAESIFVSDEGLIDDGTGLRSDVEIVAGGDNGRIRLDAGISIAMGDQVQLSAAQATAGAVSIDSQSVSLGSEFQIETGGGLGVARLFAVRPDQGLSETAFYDATSVSTTTLEQAPGNGAKGVLTVDVGNTGERGLTIIVDWGAPTSRFQQIDGVSGDAPDLQIQHFYTQQDLVESTLNGRESSTDPLEVRFAVRHHESIVMTGQSISQAGNPTEDVPGGLLSSTDNPLTQLPPGVPALENGIAQFIIPSLNIPTYFVPVRDVIPVFESTPLVTSASQTFTTIDTGFESSQSAVSATGTRDEFFQIRVLSPDPDEQDLVPPIRLPDNIISGDKLKNLFETLPDGRYDIQYVFGDGNVRSILSVDLRDGKPVVPGDNLDGGTLRLRPVEPGEIPAESQDRDGQTVPIDVDQVQYKAEPSPVLQAFDGGEELNPVADPIADADSPIEAAGQAESKQVATWVVRDGVSGDEVRLGRLSVAGRFLNRGARLVQADDPLGEVD